MNTNKKKTSKLNGTPETDNACLYWNLSPAEQQRALIGHALGVGGEDINGKVVPADFARKLEAERNMLRRKVKSPAEWLRGKFRALHYERGDVVVVETREKTAAALATIQDQVERALARVNPRVLVLSKGIAMRPLTIREMVSLIRQQPEMMARALQEYEAEQIKKAPNGVEQRRLAENDKDAGDLDRLKREIDHAEFLAKKRRPVELRIERGVGGIIPGDSICGNIHGGDFPPGTAPALV